MPYIPEEQRRLLAYHPVPENPGQLNYLITKLVKAYLEEHPKYQDFNDVVGALECAKLEVYRRSVAPYEDAKIVENGDV